jgi:uracil-DNA glycosylase family 4
MSNLGGIAREVRKCRRCRLGNIRENAVPGEGPSHAKMFFVGEAPGRDEDESGRPFVGQSGKILTAILKSAHVRREDVFITSVNKCRPPRNRRPRVDEVAACRPYLMRQIDLVKPRAIVALGLHSLNALTTFRGSMSGARKYQFIYHDIPLIATYHPAAVLYNRPVRAAISRDIVLAAEVARTTKPRSGGIKPVKGKPFRVRVSSGAVPWNGGSRFLLIRRMDEGLWCIPKGGVEAGEMLEETALRELREEAGLKGRIVCLLKRIRYSSYSSEKEVNDDKIVHYFLARVRKGKIKLERGFEDYRWCTFNEACRILHYANDRSVMKAARMAVRRLS